MKTIYGISKIKRFKRPVVAMGVFDGVHLGHRRILKAVVKKAKETSGTSIVMTFWPHPQKENSIYSLKHRLRLIRQTGVDISIAMKFNKKLSRMPAVDFVKDILVKKIGVHYLYVGRNFRFGRNKGGDFRVLERLSRRYNFKLRLFAVIKTDHQPISSTHIRKLILKGDLALAKKLLSRPVSVLGTVIKGESLGRRLGFPTANIDPHHEILPPSGIYAVKGIFNNKTFRGVCNIGRKPTLERRNLDKHVEVYIFNFNKNIYGKDLEIQFMRKIRDEKKFASIQSLAEQVKKDILTAKRLFSLPPSHHKICLSK